VFADARLGQRGLEAVQQDDVDTGGEAGGIGELGAVVEDHGPEAEGGRERRERPPDVTGPAHDRDLRRRQPLDVHPATVGKRGSAVRRVRRSQAAQGGGVAGRGPDDLIRLEEQAAGDGGFAAVALVEREGPRAHARPRRPLDATTDGSESGIARRHVREQHVDPPAAQHALAPDGVAVERERGDHGPATAERLDGRRRHGRLEATAPYRAGDRSVCAYEHLRPDRARGRALLGDDGRESEPVALLEQSEHLVEDLPHLASPQTGATKPSADQMSQARPRAARSL
jgi:hypothetical protein